MLRSAAGWRAWVYTIARNLAVEFFRRRTGIVESEFPDPDRGPDVEDEDQNGLQLENLILLERSEIVRRLMAQLPPLQREALHLRVIDDLSYDEIAQVLGVSVSVVKSRLFRARERLRQLVADLPEQVREMLREP